MHGNQIRHRIRGCMTVSSRLRRLSKPLDHSRAPGSFRVCSMTCCFRSCCSCRSLGIQFVAVSLSITAVGLTWLFMRSEIMGPKTTSNLFRRPRSHLTKRVARLNAAAPGRTLHSPLLAAVAVDWLKAFCLPVALYRSFQTPNPTFLCITQIWSEWLVMHL